MEIISTAIYGVLFMVFIAPTLFGKKAFLYQVIKSKVPTPVARDEVFIKAIAILNNIWVFLMAISFFLVQITYSDDFVTNMIYANIAGGIIQIIGAIVSIFLPKYLMKKMNFKPRFNNIQEAFETMPKGLNKQVAKGKDIIVQFDLSGEEEGLYHLIIKNQKCTYFKSAHTNPTLTIKTDSKIWLNVVNGDLDGAYAAINNLFEMTGDATIMLYFDKLFDMNATLYSNADRTQDYAYKTFKDKKIKNIIVFDGGKRSKKLGKTMMAVYEFIEGAKSVGANVEIIKLSDYKINPCDGCFTCWSNTPGECIHNDPMIELRDKYRKADLVVFASPLYIFNVSGIMKTFMDRLLPILQPYMLIKDGMITHPDRYPEYGTQGFVTFGASGFPEVDKNFDGFMGMYRAWDSHNENSHLMGEFFITAAEMLVQPVYGKRLEKVKKTCFNAGVQIINEGKIDYKHMSDVSNPGIISKDFQHTADIFWASLDGKASYIKDSIKIKYPKKPKE